MGVVGADGIMLNVDGGLDAGACGGCCALTIFDILRPLWQVVLMRLAIWVGERRFCVALSL